MPKKPLVIQKGKKRPVVLIAGGAGFIGIHLTEYLLSHNAQVISVDNLETGRAEYLTAFSANPWFKFIKADLNQGIPEEVEKVDYIFHLAGHETYVYAEETVNLNSLLTNSLATYNLLELARKTQAKFLFVSSLDIYRGIASASNLRHYFGVSEVDQKEFSHAEAQRYAESLVWEYFKRYNLDARIVRLGEVYGPNMDLRSGGSLGRLLKSVLDKEDLLVYGEGLDKDYYVFATDAVEGLAKAMFRAGTVGKIYPLADFSPVTSLELAYVVKKKFADPGAKVVFKPSLSASSFSEISVDKAGSSELGWKPSVALENGILEVLKSFGWSAPGGGVTREEPPAEDFSESESSVRTLEQKLKELRKKRPPPRALKVPHLPEIRLKSSLGGVWSAGTAVLIAVLIPLWLVLFGPLMSILYHGWQVRNFVSGLEIDKLDGGVQKVYNHVNKVSDQLERLSWLAKILGRGDNLAATQDFMAVVLLGLEAAESTFEASPYIVERLFAVNPGVDPPEGSFSLDVKSAASKLGEAQDKLHLAAAGLQLVKAENLPQFLQKYLVTLTTYLPASQRGLMSLKAVTASLADLLGVSSPKTYLVLFQNSNELRPTGGFIGSYALLKFENGVLQDMKIDDVYNPDGQLDEANVQIEPPAPLKKYLEVQSLRIRDANWAVDFVDSAKQVSSLFTTAAGIEVDAVVAVDLGFIRRVLEVVGPIFLAAYDEEITPKNLYERAQFHSEAGYYEGSSQKKVFLSVLGEKLLSEVLSLDKGKFAQLLSGISRSLDEKHLLAYIPFSDIARELVKNNWDGRVRETEGDYLMVVDANVGSTKANYYVRRNISYEIFETTREGELKAVLTLNYVHTGSSNAWPGGPYKAFTRVLTPYKTSLIKVTQNAEGSDAKALDVTETVVIDEESGKTVFGIPFTLQAGNSTSFALEYILPPAVGGFPASDEYTLVVQKQPGTEADPLTVEFIAPFGQTIVSASDDSRVSDTLVHWTGELREDVELEVRVK